LPVWREFQVVEEAIYDALAGASAAGFDANQRVNVGLWLGSAPNALQSGRVDGYVGAFAAAVLDATAIASNAITAAKIATDAITSAKVADGALTAAKFASGAFDAVWSVAARLLTAGTNIVLAKGTGVTGFNDPTVGAIADQVWDEAIAGHAGAGSTGEALAGATAPTAAAVADAVWDEALAGHAAGGSAGAALTGAGSAGDPWSTTVPGAYGAGTAGERIGRIPNVAAGGNGGIVLADAGGRAKVDVERWQTGTPNALQSGRVDANAQVVGDKSGYALSVTPPTAGAIADAVWDEATAGHQTSGTTGRALTDSGGGGGGIAGPGALERTIGVTVGGNPLQGASIWVATDAGGANVIAGPLVTDSFGEVTVLLDAGTYYAWVRLDGYAAIVGQAISVS
jgi:hypothetical protein